MHRQAKDIYDLDQLLHPADAFQHPQAVVDDPDLTLNEKRAILAAWASDACAIEAAPELRQAPHGPRVRFDDIMDELRALDRRPSESAGSKPWRRKVESFIRRQNLERGRPLH